MECCHPCCHTDLTHPPKEVWQLVVGDYLMNDPVKGYLYLFHMYRWYIYINFKSTCELPVASLRQLSASYRQHWEAPGWGSYWELSCRMELFLLFCHHLHLQLKLTLMREGKGRSGRRGREDGKGGYWEEEGTEEEG